MADFLTTWIPDEVDPAIALAPQFLPLQVGQLVRPFLHPAEFFK
jgi:hypothetical protein